jgi:hypothetical protein
MLSRAELTRLARVFVPQPSPIWFKIQPRLASCIHCRKLHVAGRPRTCMCGYRHLQIRVRS